MSDETKTLDPSLFSISLAGIIVTGWADGEVLKIVREAPLFKDVVGTDGTVSRVKVLDKRATVSFFLMSTSPVNDLLSALATLDTETPGGAGVGAFLAVDGSGRAAYQADEAWISEVPDVSWDKEPKAREWKVRVASLKAFDGGN